MITTKAKRAGQCPICHKYWEVGDRIARLKVAVMVYGWYDIGMRKGQRWTKVAYWGHPKCVSEHEKELENE